MAEKKTKIDIFSGFLGAGKTTLIKKLIKEAFAGEQIVLIENEFGEIGIDGGFMREAGIQVNELNSGCICCSLVGDFREALKKVVETYHPDRILIEPSGVGKLSDVTRAVEGVGETLPVSLNSFVTVADVNKVKMYMKNFGEFYDDQISHASCIILSRTGSADEKKVAAAVALIQEKNPTATIVTTDWNELTGAQIVSVMDGKRDLVAELLSEAQASNAAHADEDEEEHHHHHHDHDEDGLDHSHCDHEHGHCCHHDHDHEDGEEEYGIGSFVYHRIRPFNQDKLQQFVENWPKSVVRAKGVLWFDDKREDVYVFEQAGVQITATEQGKWLAAFPKKQQKLYLAEYPDMAEKWDEKYGDREIKLVFIGQHMDRHAIVDALDECLSD